MSVGFLSAPEVDESSEAHFVVQEVDAPDTRQLSAGISVRIFVTLEELLVEQLDAPCLGEVSSMSVPGGTNESSLLEALVTAQTTVILDVCSKRRLLGEIEFARYLSVCAFCEVAA